MKKEILTLDGIRHDLEEVVANQGAISKRRGYVYIVPLLVIFMGAAVALKSPWIGLVGLIPVSYLAIVLTRDYMAYCSKKRAVYSMILRGDVSVSVERFSHVAQEILYEPHRNSLMGRAFMTKEAVFYHFESGLSWREPLVREHYKWSREFYLSPKGLENLTLAGDEFYFVSLQGHPDVSYIYPCKTFELDASLKGSQET
jgi:hypothetical protein